MSKSVAFLFGCLVGVAFWVLLPIAAPNLAAMSLKTIGDVPDVFLSARAVVSALAGTAAWIIGLHVDMTRTRRATGVSHSTTLASSSNYTYGRADYEGPDTAVLTSTIVYRTDSDHHIYWDAITRYANGNEIYKGSSGAQIGYVKNGYVYSYGGSLLARIGDTKVESLQYGDVYLTGAATSDVGKGAIWCAIRYNRSIDD